MTRPGCICIGYRYKVDRFARVDPGVSLWYTFHDPGTGSICYLQAKAKGLNRRRRPSSAAGESEATRALSPMSYVCAGRDTDLTSEYTA